MNSLDRIRNRKCASRETSDSKCGSLVDSCWIDLVLADSGFFFFFFLNIINPHPKWAWAATKTTSNPVTKLANRKTCRQRRKIAAC